MRGLNGVEPLVAYTLADVDYALQKTASWANVHSADYPRAVLYVGALFGPDTSITLCEVKAIIALEVGLVKKELGHARHALHYLASSAHHGTGFQRTQSQVTDELAVLGERLTYISNLIRLLLAMRCEETPSGSPPPIPSQNANVVQPISPKNANARRSDTRTASKRTARRRSVWKSALNLWAPSPKRDPKLNSV